MKTRLNLFTKSGKNFMLALAVGIAAFSSTQNTFGDFIPGEDGMIGTSARDGYRRGGADGRPRVAGTPSEGATLAMFPELDPRAGGTKGGNNSAARPTPKPAGKAKKNASSCGAATSQLADPSEIGPGGHMSF